MEIGFKIIVIIMLLVLCIGYIETRVQHKAAVNKHIEITDDIEKFVKQRIDKIEHSLNHGNK